MYSEIEIYKDIKYSDGYKVSNFGNVINKVGKVLKQHKNVASGYLQVWIGKSVYVHRLVITAFIGDRPEGYETCHNNGNKLDNRLSNLRYDTKTSNERDKIKCGTSSRKGKRFPSKLKCQEVSLIKKLINNKISITLISKMFKINRRSVYDIIKNKSWKYVCAID